MPTPLPRPPFLRSLGSGLCALALLGACPVERAKGSHSLGAVSPTDDATPGAAPSPDASVPRAAAQPDADTPNPQGSPDATSTGLPSSPDAALAARLAAEDPTNQVKPVDEARWLETQGRALFSALATGDARRAEAFFFPRAPFSKLKQAGNPDGYWQHLLRLYAADVARLARRHQDWAGATFESLRLQGPPQWVAPGEEHNHIGYHRARYARLRYVHAGQRYSIFVHTLITWQGRWYVTHLGPPRPLGAPVRRPRPAAR